MKNNYAEIAFVLDRSGSMASCQGAAIEGFNRFLKEQHQVEGLAKLTLVLFDDEYLVPVNALPVAEVVSLDHETYVPRGSTALLDAVGRTIDELGTRLAALPERDRPAQVIVAILTDGEENSSQNYTWNRLAAAIKRQTEQYRWTFLFLGANQDAIANAATYVNDVSGLHASSRTFARKVSGLRKAGLPNMTVEECHDAMAPMSKILREENEKERS